MQHFCVPSKWKLSIILSSQCHIYNDRKCSKIKQSLIFVPILGLCVSSLCRGQHKSSLYRSNLIGENVSDWHSFIRSLINTNNKSIYIWKISLNIVVNTARGGTTSTRQFFNYHHMLIFSANRCIVLFSFFIDDIRRVVTWIRLLWRLRIFAGNNDTASTEWTREVWTKPMAYAFHMENVLTRW